jgi:phospholipase/lecithinase/hemolysin
MIDTTRLWLRLRAVATAALLGLAAQFPLPAAADHLSNVYIFGDSLSDTGNVFTLTGFLASLRPDLIPAPLPDTPSLKGRFSDGPMWVETLAERAGFAEADAPAGMTLGPAFGGVILPGAGGNNYAVAGARAGAGGSFDAFGIATGVEVQVGFYLGGNTVDPQALYVVLVGGNDIRDAAAEPIKPLRDARVRAAAESYRDAVARLAQAGAKRILVGNSPDIGQTPEARATNRAAASTDATRVFNRSLERLLERLARDEGITIARLDMFGLFEAIVEDSARGGRRFGITDVTTPCFLQPPGTDCSSHLFADDLHPTGAGHRILGEAAAACPLGRGERIGEAPDRGGRAEAGRLQRYCERMGPPARRGGD